MNKDLTVGKTETVLWRSCLPLFGSIIFQQLYNIADNLVAGKFIGENALAAVGNSYEITLIFIAFAFGCNMGCSVLSPFYFAISAKLVTDGILRGISAMRQFMTATFTDLILRVVLAFVLYSWTKPAIAYGVHGPSAGQSLWYAPSSFTAGSAEISPFYYII